MLDKILSLLLFKDKKPKHAALTNCVCKHGVDIGAKNILNIMKQCDVESHLGALPPELLKYVNEEDISKNTAQFFAELDKMVSKRGREFSKRKRNIYELPEIANLFNTQCFLQTGEPVVELDNVYKDWSGSFGDVYKLCFPTIGVAYALKIFKSNVELRIEHGAAYEIPTAFCASKVEPKYNNRVYMAKLNGNEYMLSRWQEGKHKVFSLYQITAEYEPVSTRPRFAIYETTNREKRDGNYINKVRVDFGETYKTYYGHLSYKGRKFYRKMYSVDLNTIKNTYYQLKTSFDKSDFYDAMTLFFQEYINNNRLSLTHRQIEEIHNMLKNKKIKVFDKYFNQNFSQLYR